MGGLEAVLTGLSDEWKAQINRHRFGREIVTGLVVGMAFLFALPNVTNVSRQVKAYCTVLIHLLIIYSLLFIDFFKFDMLFFNIKMELKIYKKNKNKNHNILLS